jgi:hypothetical protein
MHAVGLRKFPRARERATRRRRRHVDADDIGAMRAKVIQHCPLTTAHFENVLSFPVVAIEDIVRVWLGAA